MNSSTSPPGTKGAAIETAERPERSRISLQRIKPVQRMQSYTWSEMLQNTAQLAGGRQRERITVRSWPQL